MMSTVQRRKTLVSKTALKFPFDESVISPINRNHQLLSWMILIFCLIEHSFSELTLPQNVATVDGARFHLNCSQGKDGSWSFINSSAKDTQSPEFITDADKKAINWKNPGFFSIDVSTKENVNLIVTASKNASGIYICKNNTFSLEEHRVHVIVLDPKPKCSKKKGSDGIVIANCSIGFGGFWPPDLEWRNAKGIVEGNEPSTVINSNVTTSFTVRYKTPAPYDLTCTPKFTLKNKPKPNEPKEEIRNIPEYPNSCTIKIEPSDGGNEPPPEETADESQKGQPPRAKGKDNGNTTDTTVSIHDWHDLHLSLRLATSVFIGMLPKWLWQ